MATNIIAKQYKNISQREQVEEEILPNFDV